MAAASRLARVAVECPFGVFSGPNVRRRMARRGIGMTAQVTSVFLYVDDVQKSLEFV